MVQALESFHLVAVAQEFVRRFGRMSRVASTGPAAEFSLPKVGSPVCLEAYIECPCLCGNILNLFETELASIPSLLPEHFTYTSVNPLQHPVL